MQEASFDLHYTRKFLMLLILPLKKFILILQHSIALEKSTIRPSSYQANSASVLVSLDSIKVKVHMARTCKAS